MMNQPLKNDTSRTSSQRLKYVSFTLEDAEFCVDILTVREIAGSTSPTPIPRAPDYVSGVINLRGTVLPIIDFAERVGLQRAAKRPARPVTIIMQVENRLFGIKVDAVSDILLLDRADMQPIPEQAREVSTRFLQSIIALDDRMIRIVDPAMLCPALEAQD
jgi:purine-binding chemotaxis protein CheW